MTINKSGLRGLLSMTEYVVRLIGKTVGLRACLYLNIRIVPSKLEMVYKIIFVTCMLFLLKVRRADCKSASKPRGKPSSPGRKLNSCKDRRNLMSKRDLTKNEICVFK